MLTAKDGEWDQAEALDAGADDYLTKPFSLRCAARPPARPGEAGCPWREDEPSVLRCGDLVLDHRERRCTRGDDEIMLSRREFDILGVLLSRRGEAVSKDELMDRIWGPEFNGDPNILEVYVSYLRKKIDAPLAVGSLETVRGFGYRLIDEHPELARGAPLAVAG